jgi:hypothetical protein
MTVNYAKEKRRAEARDDWHRTLFSKATILRQRAIYAAQLDARLRTLYDGACFSKLQVWDARGAWHRKRFLFDYQVMLSRGLYLELSGIFLSGSKNNGCEIEALLENIKTAVKGIHGKHRLFQSYSGLLDGLEMDIFYTFRPDIWREMSCDMNVYEALQAEFEAFRNNNENNLRQLKKIRDTVLAHTEAHGDQVERPLNIFLKQASLWGYAYSNLILHLFSASGARRFDKISVEQGLADEVETYTNLVEDITRE